MIVLPLAFALCFAAFAAFAAAMPRHWRQIGSARRHAPRALRVIGGATAIGALAACGTIWNPARAIPVVLGLASVAAIGVGFTLSFAPRALLAIAAILILLAGVFAIWR